MGSTRSITSELNQELSSLMAALEGPFAGSKRSLPPTVMSPSLGPQKGLDDELSDLMKSLSTPMTDSASDLGSIRNVGAPAAVAPAPVVPAAVAPAPVVPAAVAPAPVVPAAVAPAPVVPAAAAAPAPASVSGIPLGSQLDSLLDQLDGSLAGAGVMPPAVAAAMPPAQQQILPQPVVPQPTQQAMLPALPPMPADPVVCGCGVPVQSGQIVTAMGRKWHPQCFKCYLCETSLIGKTFFQHEGRPLCQNDYAQLFSPRCMTCQQPIIGPCMTALNNKYHPACFVCASCRGELPGGQFFERNGLPVCPNCHMY